MSEGPGGPQGATAGGTLAMRMLSQQAMVASQMKRATRITPSTFCAAATITWSCSTGMH